MSRHDLSLHSAGRGHSFNRVIIAGVRRPRVVKTFGLAEPIARALEPLRARIVWAVIYGSVAKKVDSASSDIDILLVSDQVALEDVFNVLDPVERQLQRKINPVLLTSAEFAKRAKSGQGFVSRVIQGEYLPIMGDMDVTPAAR